MKKRLALALALIHDPRVLILDEPTNGLDPAGARQMRATIAELAAGGRTIFLSTHLLDAAERLCHRVAIIQRGRLQAVGTPDELRARYERARHDAGGSLPARDDGGAEPVADGGGVDRPARPIDAAPAGGAPHPLPAALDPQRVPRARRGGRRVLATVVGVVIAVGLRRPVRAGVLGHRRARSTLPARLAALALVTGTIAFGSLAAKAASSEAVRAGSPENEFLLARPVSLPALVAARGLADAVTDPVGGAVSAAGADRGARRSGGWAPSAWPLAAAISLLVQIAISMLAYAIQLAVVRYVPAGAAADRLDGACAWSAALALATLWMLGTWVLRAPAALATQRRRRWAPVSRSRRRAGGAPLAALVRGEPGHAVGGARGARLAAVAAALLLAVARRAPGRDARLGGGRRGLGGGDARSASPPARLPTAATKDLRLIVRDRSQLLALVAMPVIFVGVQIFGAAGWSWTTGSLRASPASRIRWRSTWRRSVRSRTCRPSGARSGSCARCRCRSAAARRQGARLGDHRRRHRGAVPSLSCRSSCRASSVATAARRRACW